MTTQRMYAELYRLISDTNSLSRRRIAQQTGLHHSKVIRILDKGADARFDVMADIGKAVGADPVRALIAILVLKDPDAYFSPAVKVVAQLLTTLACEISNLDEHLFEGFISQEYSALISLTLKTMVSALERRDRRFTFI